MTTNKKLRWYVASTGNHQGLIVDEESGANIAIAYDKQHAPLLASAPELLAALQRNHKLLDELRFAATAFYLGAQDSESRRLFDKLVGDKLEEAARYVGSDAARLAIQRATEGRT